jgi:hypothetical protein
MKINLSPADQKLFEKLLIQMEENIREADFYNDILIKKTPVGISSAPRAIVELKISDYVKNPYYQRVQPHPFKDNDWELKKEDHKPFEGFVYDEIEISPKDFYREKTNFGFFPERFEFLALKQEGVTWMSITPHEIATMDEPSKKAQGQVVALGLGLGYFAFMASLRKEVTKVLIIEREKTAIDIFEKELLPFFPQKEKIEVLEMDAFDYLKKPQKKFDFLFADLWHLPEDGLYLQIKNFEARFPDSVFSYWIEKSILSLLRRALLILMDEEIKGSADEDYDFAATQSDLVVNALHFALKEKTIESFREAMDLLSDDSLKNLSLSLNLDRAKS